MGTRTTEPAVSGAAGRMGVRSIRAEDVLLDTSPARQVLTLWKNTPRHGSSGGRAGATRIARTPAYRTTRAYMKQLACTGTEAEIARAIELPDSGLCGFGMDPAYQSQKSIEAMVRELDARKVGLRKRIATRVGRYLPQGRRFRTTTVWFVIASQGMFDAVTLDTHTFDRDFRGRSVEPDPELPKEPVVLVNLTEVLSYGSTTKERIDELEHVLAHEMFHAAIKNLEPELPGWSEAAQSSTQDPDVAYIARVMLDEGIAHYVDWRDRAGADTLFAWKPGSNERRAFERLGSALTRIHNATTRGERLETVQLAGHGPLWSKYGAISGMFAAYRIEMARGLAGLREAVAAGPNEFLRTYREVAAHNPALLRISSELIVSQ
ncbi:MAG TPA: DUF5700 domain-containing putative Zn-dependent protease [Candidatus Eisenbacteria bacterium]|nr:DUF5700 domain-containing putative Zn-dependent protease [Candidatus Eisenbacteria bacterium]